MANPNGIGGQKAGEPGRNPKGRPRNEERDAINQALDKALPLADVVARLAKLVDRGNIVAIKLWLAYRWGEPIQRQEVTGKDGAPVEITEVVIERPVPDTRT